MSTRSDNTDSTVEHVLAYLREGIVNGQFPPRSKLLPKRIAESCGTSFIPVREALRVLESEGFVTFVHHRGAWVTPLSLSDLEDLYAIRIEMEGEAVRRAQPFTKDEIEHLDALLAESRECNDRGNNAARLIELNRDFHFAIYEKAESPRRIKLITQLWQHSARYQRLSLLYRHDAADAEHRRVLSALRKGDHVRAAAALEAHLSMTVKLIRAAVQDAGTSVRDMIAT